MTEQNFNRLKPAFACGIIAAASASLLWVSLLQVPLLPVLFGIGASLPIFYALFSGGLAGGVIAAVLAAVLLCLSLPLDPALIFAGFFFPPALLTGWLLSLRVSAPAGKNAPAAGQSVASAANAAPNHPAGRAPAAAPANPNTAPAAGFYPLSAALFQLALAVAFVAIAVLFFIFSRPDAVRAFDNTAAQIIQFMQDNKLYDMAASGPDTDTALRRFLPILFAVSLALYGFLFQMAALYGALRLAARTRILRRPRPFWPAELRMPPLAAAVFILLWIGSFFIDAPQITASPTLALCLNIILTALSVSFCAAGLAVLHQVARGSWLWLRIVVYICLFSLALTPVIFFGLVLMGLFATPFPAFGRDRNPPA